MSKNKGLFVAVLAVMMIVLAACGGKSQEDVVGKLEKKLESMNGYKVKADMLMNTGQEEQNFDIDVLHKKDAYYRVQLNNDQDEHGSQIILKNDDGVFVLTPELEKSFKFQSDWPENSSQPYLYQSLVNDILKDEEAEFHETEQHFTFKTKTNYQSNNNLPYQEIYFDKKTYTPVLVKVLDKDQKALVEVKFSKFEMDPEFSDKDFVLEENMETEDKDKDVATSADQELDTFTVMFPLFMAGSELMEKKEINLDDGKRVIMTFGGEKHFTLIEEKRKSMEASAAPKEVKGDIVNIGHSIGALADGVIEWTKDGVDFYLTSEELTKEELIEVAKSVQGKEVK
ncbi:Sporulation protein YdcC [Lentibacillus sp. JNUCC-1]|uniref:LolA family protein n=1 Tax=Lentibacillus sp. JNUCC-1 TaxID=2654513 RepID=UPI0012E8C4A1|nr:outer membrane lipoprotein carrier protein LolA [Lentibacillus sp. JNUCC-1]MUV38499.1 Sporulation protein YdcC [Lentibacillus sp. JNUCC-1]